jgi:hypothetical protein
MRLDVLPLGYVMEQHGLGSGPQVLYLQSLVHPVGFLYWGVVLCLISVQLGNLEGSLLWKIGFNLECIWVHADGKFSNGVRGPKLPVPIHLGYWGHEFECPYPDALPLNKYEDTNLLWGVIGQRYSGPSFLHRCNSQWSNGQDISDWKESGTQKHSDRRAAVFLPGHVHLGFWDSTSLPTPDNRIAVFPVHDLFKFSGLSTYSSLHDTNNPAEIQKMGDGSVR